MNHCEEAALLNMFLHQIFISSVMYRLKNTPSLRIFALDRKVLNGNIMAPWFKRYNFSA